MAESLDSPLDLQMRSTEDPLDEGDRLENDDDSSDKSSGKANSQDHTRQPAKRKKRAHRRKAKQVNDGPYETRVIVRDNENLVKFYKHQSFLKDEREFEEFMESLRTSLPASFRINAFDYDQARILRHLVRKQFDEFYEASEKQTSEDSKQVGTEENGSQPATVPTIEQLPWYPKCLAWQMNISRVDLRKSPALQALHKFIMAETDNGFISRQESVSMIPPLVLDVKRGQTILDMCAAPGSKTAQLLEYLNMNIHSQEDDPSTRVVGGEELFDDGLVVANDVDNKRCYMLVHQSNRLNSPNCTIINEDASRLPDMLTADKHGNKTKLKFDRILCDAPCSGDGTLRKNPDVWRKWSVGSANNFHGMQSRILRRGVEMLKEGGLIVYSTCSMNPVEDEAVVANILRLGQGDLVLEDCSSKLHGLKFRPGVTKWAMMSRDMEVVEKYDQVKPEQQTQLRPSMFPPTDDEIKKFELHKCIRMLPHIQNTGGFFIAVIRKLSSTLPHEKRFESRAEMKSEQCDGVVQATAVEANQRPPLQQYPRKKRTYHGFKEEPFIFLDSQDPDWLTIKEFYGIVDNFPVHQLTHRSSQGKKRSIHLVSKQTGGFIAANQELPERTSFVKVINGGMRLFSRAGSEAGFRICQDGVNEILPYVKKDLIVQINRYDLIELLARKAVPFEQLSAGEHFKDKLKLGSCILMWAYQNDEVQKEPITIPLVAWRGERCIALYVSNPYKVHLQALVHNKVPEAVEAEKPTPS